MLIEASKNNTRVFWNLVSECFDKYMPLNFYVSANTRKAHFHNIFSTLMADIREVYEDKTSISSWPPVSSKEVLILIRCLKAH